MLFITLMTKMSDTAEAKYKKNTNKALRSRSRAPQGRRPGDEHLEVLVGPGSAGRTPSCRQELSSSSVAKRKSREEARVSTQLVLNKYNTKYEALRLAESTALAFNHGKILLKLITTSW